MHSKVKEISESCLNKSVQSWHTNFQQVPSLGFDTSLRTELQSMCPQIAPDKVLHFGCACAPSYFGKQQPWPWSEELSNLGIQLDLRMLLCHGSAKVVNTHLSHHHTLIKKKNVEWKIPVWKSEKTARLVHFCLCLKIWNKTII